MSGLGSTPVKSQRSQLLLNRKFKTLMRCGAVGSFWSGAVPAQFICPGTGKSYDLILFGERFRRLVNSVVPEKPQIPVRAAEFTTRV